jgi:hypothetical protein
MAPPINAPVAGEIWHLSIEDLFQPVQGAPRLGGDGPFVINLSVSTAPINLPSKSFTSRQDAHVYQIQITEDGRTRFRLRLGPFRTEDEADAMLAEVRDTYPGALTATASSSDLRAIESLEAKASQRLASQKALAAQKQQASQKAADKAAIEDFVSLKSPAKAASKKAAPQPSAPAPINIIEAAVKAEIAKVEAEISIDLAWPAPQVKVPEPVPAKAAIPVVTAAEPPVIKIAPEPVVKAAPPSPPAVKSAAVAPSKDAAPSWVLPELDIPLPVSPPRATAPTTVVEPAPAVPKPLEVKTAPPLSLLEDAPLLTEVVVSKRAAPREAAKKPVIAAPVLTEVVITKAKPVKAALGGVASPKVTAANPLPSKKTAPANAPAPNAAPIPAPTPPAALTTAAAALDVVEFTPPPPAPVVPVVVAHVPPAIVAPVVAPPIAATVAPPVAATVASPIAATVAPPTTQPTAPVPVVAAVVAPPTIQPPAPAPVVAAVVPPSVTSSSSAPPSVPVSATGTVKTLAKPPAAPAAGSAARKSAARAVPPPPQKPLPVIPQSLVMPRKGIMPKFAKPMPGKLKSLQHVVVATAPAPLPREVKKLDEPLPDLESTQTIRALTPKELEENDRWFVIQLALADHAFDPEAVPNLDIFSEYRLYSVAGLDQGRVVHALRLGFFKEEIGAVAVASYLAAYWDKPTIKRVSVAERERFADKGVEARKDIGATGRHSVIEITDELVARRRRATKALNTPPDQSAEH